MIALILLKLLIFKNLNSMMRLFFISCLLFVCLGGAFGQEPIVLDTISLNWDTLKVPGVAPFFYNYSGNSNRLIAVKSLYPKNAQQIVESRDTGKTWTILHESFSNYIIRDANILAYKLGDWSAPYSENGEIKSSNVITLYMSTDFGMTFNTLYKYPVIKDCWQNSCSYPEINYQFGHNDSIIIVGIRDNINFLYKTTISKDKGKSWQKIDNSQSLFSFQSNGYSYIKKGKYLYYTNNTNLIYSDSVDMSNCIPNAGYPQYPDLIFVGYDFIVKDSILSIYRYDGLVVSTKNKGLSWIIDSLPFQYSHCLIKKHNNYFYAFDGKLHRSKYASFKDSQAFDVSEYGGSSFYTLPSGLYMYDKVGQLLFSKDDGVNWEVRNNNDGVLGMAKVFTFGDSMIMQSINLTNFKLKDFNKIEIIPNLQHSYQFYGESKESILKFKNFNFYYNNYGIFKGKNLNGLWDTLYTSNLINSFKQDSSRLYFFVSVPNKNVDTLFIYDNDLSVPTKKVLNLRDNSNSQIKDLHFFKNQIFASVYQHPDSVVIYKSKDEGDTWQKVAVKENCGSEILHSFKDVIWSINSCGTITESLDLGETWLNHYSSSKSDSNYSPKILKTENYILYSNPNKKLLAVTHDKGKTNINFNNIPNKQLTINEPFLYASNIGFDSLSDYKVYRIHLDSIKKRVIAAQDYPILKGQIFKDQNENCQKDTTENGIAEKTIRIMPRNYTTITDKNGRFAVALPPDTYTISTSNIQYHKATCGDTILKNITLKANEKRDTQIVFKQSEKAYDLSASLTTGSRARPGFELDFVVKTQNLGTENIDSALITLDMPSNLEFKEANQNGIFKNNQIVWILKNSGVDDSKTFTARLRLAPTTPLSIPLTFKVKASIFYQKDTFPLNNVDSVRLNVTGSFDPNDKTVLPEGKIPFFTNELDYLIRFQNTGNDTAFKVVVVDTLPPQLDVVSLKTISASHPYVVSLKKNIITFTFDNILLPDSNVNERASHGFIRFKLKPQNGLKVGDNINNKAAIYFDYNKPIITNIAQLELIKPMIIVPQNKTLCKGDSYKSKLYFDNTTVYDTTKSLLYDTTFITAININPTYQISKDTILKANEKLFNKHVENGEIVIVKLNTISGCDSSIIYKVSKLSTKTQDLPEGFLSLKIYPNPVKDYLSISYELNKITFVEIALYNSIGQKVKILREKRPDTEGGHRMTYDAKDLEEGWYQMTIETEQGVFTQRFIKIK
jgi:uncharacterized repeat protein (TIGR01451 family)